MLLVDFAARSLLLVVCGIHSLLQSRVTHICVLGDFLTQADQKIFEEMGDVNIGLLVQMTSSGQAQLAEETGGGPTLCNGPTHRSPVVRISQAAAFAARKINKERRLPRNLTLGFVIFDVCHSETAATLSSLSFVREEEECKTSTSDSKCKTDFYELNKAGIKGRKTFDVVAVISSVTSSQAVLVANALGPGEMTTLCIRSTNEEVSNKVEVPYFVTLAPTEEDQFAAIFAVISEMGWSYVHMVIANKGHGERAYNYIKTRFTDTDKCVATVHKVRSTISKKDAEKTCQKMASNPNARGVILVVTRAVSQELMTTCVQLVPKNHFIFIGIDSMGSLLHYLSQQGVNLEGSMAILSAYQSVPEFDEWFKSLQLPQLDPWIPAIIESVFNCSLVNNTCDESLPLGARQSAPENFDWTSGGLFYDAVDLVVNATSKIVAQCPGDMRVQDCVTSEKLYNTLVPSLFHGRTGLIKIDHRGNSLKRLVVTQIAKHRHCHNDHDDYGHDQDGVVYENETECVNATTEDINKTLNHLGEQIAFYYDPVFKTLIREGGFRWPGAAPQSTCSKTCPDQHATIFKSRCCWRCRPCREDQRLLDNNTDCCECEGLSWPDPSTNYTTCSLIEPDMLRISEFRGVIQAALSLFFLLLCIFVFFFYISNGHDKVIKASSIVLSFIMLCGLVVGFVSILLMLLDVDETLCRMNYALYSASFALLYSPLLVRTQRIYRIFNLKAGMKPPCISNWHQVVFSAILVSLQVSVTSVNMLLQDKWVHMARIFPYSRLVEYTCYIRPQSLISTLAINMTLIAACVVMAFKTRHLPHNFNESSYISKCVSTTMVILMCFTPSYFVAASFKLKMQVLALSIGLNHVVSLSLLFLPKVYRVLHTRASERKASMMRRISTYDSAKYGHDTLKRFLLRVRRKSLAESELISSTRGTQNQTCELLTCDRPTVVRRENIHVIEEAPTLAVSLMGTSVDMLGSCTDVSDARKPSVCVNATLQPSQTVEQVCSAFKLKRPGSAHRVLIHMRSSVTAPSIRSAQDLGLSQTALNQTASTSSWSTK